MSVVDDNWSLVDEVAENREPFEEVQCCNVAVNSDFDSWPADDGNVCGASNDNNSNRQDWDLVSIASSVWTADASMCSGGAIASTQKARTFRDVVLQHRPNQVSTARPVRLGATLPKILLPRVTEDEDDGLGGEDNFGLTVWEDQKCVRGGKPAFRPQPKRKK